MSYVILRKADTVATPDFEDFNINCLDEHAQFQFHKHTHVYYSEDLECYDPSKMEKIK